MLDEYQTNAARCIKEAQQMTSKVLKQGLFAMAEMWLQLALRAAENRPAAHLALDAIETELGLRRDTAGR
jgi:hypothetical protein